MPASGDWKLSGAILTGVVVLLAWPAGEAAAARIRYHYAPAPPGTCMKIDPVGGAQGQRLTWSASWEPYNCPPPRPTCQMNYRHPCTGQMITVPLALPDSTPRLEHRGNRVIYDYGSYTVEVNFLADGSVDVIYNSGLFRAP
jgi:hypothetical protein